MDFFFRFYGILLGAFLYCAGVAIIPVSIILFARWASRKKKDLPVSKRTKRWAVITAVLAVVLYIIPGIISFGLSNFRKYTVGPEFNLMQTRIETTAGFYDFTYKNEYYNELYWIKDYDMRQEPTVILIDPSDEYLECFEYKCGNGTILLLSTDGDHIFAPYDKMDDLESYYVNEVDLTFEISENWKAENRKPLKMDRDIYKVLMAEDQYDKEEFPERFAKEYYLRASSEDGIYHENVRIYFYNYKFMINAYAADDKKIKGEVIPAEYSEKLIDALKDVVNLYE